MRTWAYSVADRYNTVLGTIGDENHVSPAGKPRVLGNNKNNNNNNSYIIAGVQKDGDVKNITKVCHYLTHPRTTTGSR